MGSLQINRNTIIKQASLGLNNNTNTYWIKNESNGVLTIKRNDFPNFYLAIDKIGNIANVVNNNRNGWSGYGWVNGDTSEDLAYLYLWVEAGKAYQLWIGDSNDSDNWWWKLDPNGTMTVKKTLFPAKAETIVASDPMAITYGRIACNTNLYINANTDNNGTEYIILTAGKGLSSSAADGLAIGANSLTYKNATVLTSSNYSATKMKVLWTNSNGTFPAQTVTCSLSGYDYFLITGFVSWSGTEPMLYGIVRNYTGQSGYLSTFGPDYWMHTR